MVDNISTNTTASTNTYIKNYFNTINPKKNGEHVVKKGESLWNIAKGELGNNASRGEIQNYMMQIAKLNGFDTIEKMNNINVNSTISLPAKTTKATTKPDSKETAATKATQKPDSKGTSATKATTKPDQKNTPTKTHEQQQVEKIANQVLTDKSITLQKAWGRNIYHVYKIEKPNTKSRGFFIPSPVTRLQMSFETDKNGNIIDYSFYEHIENSKIKRYDIKGNNIVEYDNLNPSNIRKKCGTINNKVLDELDKKLKSLI